MDRVVLDCVLISSELEEGAGLRARFHGPPGPPLPGCLGMYHGPQPRLGRPGRGSSLRPPHSDFAELEAALDPPREGDDKMLHWELVELYELYKTLHVNALDSGLDLRPFLPVPSRNRRSRGPMETSS